MAGEKSEGNDLLSVSTRAIADFKKGYVENAIGWGGGKILAISGKETFLIMPIRQASLYAGIARLEKIWRFRIPLPDLRLL